MNTCIYIGLAANGQSAERAGTLVLTIKSRRLCKNERMLYTSLFIRNTDSNKR